MWQTLDAVQGEAVVGGCQRRLVMFQLTEPSAAFTLRPSHTLPALYPFPVRLEFIIHLQSNYFTPLNLSESSVA